MPRNLKTFDSFKNPVYRLYYYSTAGQWASMSMQMVARSLLVYRLTDSGAILGSVALAQALPILFLSPLGGALADRLQKKHILFAGQIVSAILTLSIALSLTLGYLSAEHTGSWWVLIASAAIQGIIMGLKQPANESIIREIVDEHQMMNAVSLSNMGRNVFQLVGPGLGGILIDTWDFDVVYYTTTGLYLLGAVFVFFMPRTRVITGSVSNPVADIPEGFRYVRRESLLLLVLFFALASSMLGMPITQMMPMFSEDVLEVSATGLGILLMVSGFGALLGSLVLASIPSQRRGLMFLISTMIMGLSLVGFSLSRWWYLSLVLIFICGLMRSGKITLENALLQSYSDINYRGRVLSLLTMQSSFASFGTFVAGVLAEATTVQWSIGGMAVVLVVISVGMWLYTPRLRRLD